MKNKGFKFKIELTDEQKSLVHQTFGCSRLVYNLLLDERFSVYEMSKHIKDEKERKKHLSKYKYSTPAVLKKDFEFLKDVDALALANAQMNLKQAFNRFYNKQTRLPKFKSRKFPKQSYTTNNIINNKGHHSIRLSEDGKYIHLPKLKWVRIKMHRQLPKNGLIKNVTVSCKNQKYFVAINVEYPEDVPLKDVQKITDDKIVGLDFMMNGLFYLSTGEVAQHRRFYRESEQQLKKAQRILSRREKGSKRWYKQKLKVQKLHEKIANKRHDLLHKLSFRLAEDYDVICIEDLNMQNMAKALHFGKSVGDNGWGKFTTLLKYKLDDRGKYLIKINQWHPSSKTCSSCGEVKTKLHLNERVYHCEHCGAMIDRDENAALNIKHEGKRLLYEQYGLLEPA